MDGLPFGLTPEALIMLASFAVAVLTVFALWNAFMHRDPMAAKARELARKSKARAKTKRGAAAAAE